MSTSKTSNLVEITTRTQLSDFISNQSVPVVLAFSSKWCGPCRVQKPILEQCAEQWKDKALVITIDVNEGAQLARDFNIFSIPTIVIFQANRPAERLTGVQSRETLEKILF